MGRLRVGLMGLAVSVLSACGGGGGDDSPAPVIETPPPVVTTTGVPITVIDGAIRNALVCLDKNDNGGCDVGEPSGRTDTNGKVNLQVDNADVGKYPVLALADTQSVDADHGPITVPFAMKAPADQTAVISPLTTLVQAYKATSGSSTAAAEAAVQAQTGITVSLFQDFTTAAAKADSASVFAGDLARIVVLTTQAQASALSSVVGTVALDNKSIGSADIMRIIQQKLLEILPSLVQAATAAAGAADKDANLSTAAAAIVSTPATGIDTVSVALSVAANNQAANNTGTVETPTAGATLRQLSYTDSDNWLMRASRVSAANAVVSNGVYVSAADRQRMSAGTLVRWGFGREPSRNADLHFTGTAWASCGFPAIYRNSPRDGSGRTGYNLCDGYEIGNSTTAWFSVAGRPMLEVYNQLAGYGNIAIASAGSVLGSATFPAGSSVQLRADAMTASAVAYYPGRANRVLVSNAEVAAGKTSASDTTSACAFIAPATPTTEFQAEATTLEETVQRSQGTPCVYNPGSVSITLPGGTTGTVTSGPRNEWWGQSSLALQTIGSAGVGGVQSGYFTTNTLLRVAFSASGNVAKYYACQQRSTDGSPRNCDLIGQGTYTIASLGDGRAMSFTNLPVQTAALTYELVLVERGGSVYFGYRNKPVATTSARLNKVAANALLSLLGIASLDEEAVVTTTPGSFAGAYDVSEGGISTKRIYIDAAGLVSGCQATETVPYAFQQCSGSITADGVLTAQFEGNNGEGGVQRVTIDFLTGRGVGTFTPTAGPVKSNLSARR